MKILVTGAQGQLGIAIGREFRRAHDVVGLSFRDLDITDHAAVLRAVERERPAAIINCAAFNDVDGAEDHALTVLEVNAFAVRSLVRAAGRVGATLVHYSSDFVFDGETDRPYVEDDRPNPRSTYGASKLVGDWFALECDRAYLLRVESLFGGVAEEGFRHQSSIDRIIEAIAGGREARVFVDRVVSPSYVVDLAAVTRRVLERAPAPGLYHAVNSGHTTWYELGREIARLLGSDEARLVPVPVADVKLRVDRPKFAALSNAKLAAAGFAMPTWQDALARYLSRAPS